MPGRRAPKSLRFVVALLGSLSLAPSVWGEEPDNEPQCADLSASEAFSRDTVQRIPTTGTTRIPVIFVKFADDDFFNGCPGTVDGWPPSGSQKPSWAPSFIDPQYSPKGSYTDGSLSDYFSQMSYGAFNMVGDVFPAGPEAWVPLDDSGNPAPQSYYFRNLAQPLGNPLRRGMGYLIRKILMDLDDEIDFSQYDNNPRDGWVNGVALLFRSFSMQIVGCFNTYSGIAALDPCRDGFFPLTLDGVRLGSYYQGWHQRDTFYLDGTRELAAHEVGHLLRSGGHDDGLGSWGYGDGRPIGRGGIDKLLLGWATATDVSQTRLGISLPELQSSAVGTILRVGPYLVENRQRSRYELPYRNHCGGISGTPGTGMLITTSTRFLRPADRAYQFPGDAGDTWSSATQLLFSPWSNPQADSQVGYAIQTSGSAGRVQADVWLRDAHLAPPSEVMGLQVSGASGSSPSLSWLASREPDAVGYHVYRSRGGGYARVTASPVSGTRYIDTQLVVVAPPFEARQQLPGPRPPLARKTYYRVVAVDSQGLTSSLAGADIRGGLWTLELFPTAHGQ